MHWTDNYNYEKVLKETKYLKNLSWAVSKNQIFLQYSKLPISNKYCFKISF